MSTSKLLQKPSIIQIIGSTIRVAHPDISGYPRTYLRSSIAAAGTTATVADNNGFADNDWFIIGEVGDMKTEDNDVNGAVTRGTSITCTISILKFGHDIDSPFTRILERGIAIYGINATTGTGTIIESVGAKTASGTQLADAVMIQWDKEYTEYTMITTDTTYTHYYVVFTDGTTDSDASDYILAAGLGSTAIQHQVNSALEMTDEEISVDGKITREFLLEQCNKWQDEVTQYVYTDPRDGSKKIKNWPFEEADDTSSITATENENEYALSSLSNTIKFSKTNQAIIDIRFGTGVLDYISPSEMDKKFEGIHRTNVATAITASDTSIVLDNTYELTESGTVNVGADTITYTGNTETTGTLTGCTGVDNSHSVDAAVWQNVTPGLPDLYTVFNGTIILNKPVDTNYVGYVIRVKYYKALTRFSDFSDTTVVSFYNTLETWLRARIESKKGNEDVAAPIYANFTKQLSDNASSNFAHLTDGQDYYSFGSKDYGYSGRDSN